MLSYSCIQFRDTPLMRLAFILNNSRLSIMPIGSYVTLQHHQPTSYIACIPCSRARVLAPTEPPWHLNLHVHLIIQLTHDLDQRPDRKKIVWLKSGVGQPTQTRPKWQFLWPISNLPFNKFIVCDVKPAILRVGLNFLMNDYLIKFEN